MIEGALYGDGFFNRAKFFEELHAHANAGGFDVTKLYDSPGDDQFVATPTYGGLSGEGFHNWVKFFDAVHAYATAGGYDVAKLYDSPGDDSFAGKQIDGALFREGYYYNRAKYFEGVYAYATAGGRDTAWLYDSAGDDTFVATPTESALFGDDFYNRAKFFEEVYAEASDGYDEGYLYDSPSVDLLEASGNWARLSNASLDFLFQAGAFDYVKATASTSGDTKDVATLPLAFILDLEGPWEDA
jgi:hypothetical protein